MKKLILPVNRRLAREAYNKILMTVQLNLKKEINFNQCLKQYGSNFS